MKYAISFDAFGKRRTFIVRLTQRIARFVGRHVWRLGARRWQIEEGAFASSYIASFGQPVTRAADHIETGWFTTCDSYPRQVEMVDVRRSTPPRFTNINGLPVLLIEAERTNVALWSNGKPSDDSVIAGSPKPS